MKVCFFVNMFGKGGTERVNTIVGNGLSNKNVDVSFFTALPAEAPFPIIGNYYSFSGFSKLDTIWNYRKFIEIIFKGEYTPEKYFKKAISEFIKINQKEKFDIVVLSNGIPISFIPKLKEKFPNTKFIAWVHSSYERTINPNSFDNSSKIGLNYETSVIKGLKNADAVIALTDDELYKYRKLNKNVNRIYNPLTISTKGKANLSSNKIAFLGRISINVKGLDYLAEIGGKLPNDWEILIGGDGSDEENAKLDKLILEYNAENKIQKLGNLDDVGIKELFEQSSIFIMTSRVEGFPLVLVEAMSYGLPIIAFEQSGSNAALSNGEYGILVENGDTKMMLKKLKMLINSLEVREEYSKKSLERCKDFSVDKIVEEWEKLLQKV